MPNKSSQGNALFQRKPEASYIFNPQYKFIYCPIPKCACTSLGAMVYELFLKKHPELPVFLAHEFESAGFHQFLGNFTLSRHAPEKARAALFSDEIFKFTFVRHPMDRIASAYLDKFIRNRFIYENWDHTAPVLKAFFNNVFNPYLQSITFHQFINYLCERSNEQLDRHWQPMSCFVNPELDMFIGHVESFETDFGEIHRKLGLPGDINHLNKTERSGTDLPDADYWNMSADELRRLACPPKVRQMYNQELMQAVNDRYRIDFERFSYPYGTRHRPPSAPTDL